MCFWSNISFISKAHCTKESNWFLKDNYTLSRECCIHTNILYEKCSIVLGLIAACSSNSNTSKEESCLYQRVLFSNYVCCLGRVSHYVFRERMCNFEGHILRAYIYHVFIIKGFQHIFLITLRVWISFFWGFKLWIWVSVPFVLNRFLMVYSLRAGRFITCKKDTLPKSHQNRDTNRTFLQFLANTRF